ncbi:MAG TPA: PEGA domain-containing protein [Vicinamibacterales bacterium]|nr:PEGA domain-containing protein [Vicinamibacterales bacterium]
MTAMFRPDSTPPPPAESNANELLAFPSEATLRQEHASSADVPKSKSIPFQVKSATRKTILAVVIVAGVAAGFALVTLRRIPLPSFATTAPRTGNLTIATQPPAADVLVDGERRGTTPLTLALAAGAHTITIQGDGDTRVLPLTIAAGADVTQHFELKTREAVAQFGRVSIVTEPPGARVSIDGRSHGVSPLVVADLTAEEHLVTVTNDGGTSERKVLVTPGNAASVIFALAGKTSGPVGGWLSVSSPFDVEVAENNDVIGASRSSRIMLAAGRHDVVLTNRSLGYQETRKLDVIAGKTTTLRVEPPRVTISVNARPWAEVLMDGTNVGQTPLANLLVTVGSHELVFRNPQLGERRQTVLVTVTGPNRVAADLTK